MTARPAAAPPPGVNALTRKPMAGARRVTLLEREVRERLSPAGIEILLDRAEVLSEGQRHGGSFFGSTMLTLDLALLEDLVREPCDAVLARRTADLVRRDRRVAARLRALAAAEAERLAGRKVELGAAETAVRAEGSRLHLDVDFEARLV